MGIGKMPAFETIEEKLYSGVLSDILDEMGLRRQVMSGDIRPVYPEAVVAGRAATALSADVYDPEEDTLDAEIEAVDALKKGEVLLATTNGSTRAALWGELLSTASRAREARGAIIDGLTRDVRQIVEMRFPVFASGIRPISFKGRCRIIDHGCRIECGGVLVNPGDLVFGDVDGVVVIPSSVAEEAVSRALDVVEKENLTREELRRGAFLKDVYEKYGAL
jgi:regulator of RNase E activity RraA